MKILLSMILLTVSVSASSRLSKEWRDMSQKEKGSILKSYTDGLEDNIGLTLAAINWQESRGGRWQISIDKNDYGIYHVNLNWYFKTLGIKDNPYNRSQYGTLFITDPDIPLQYVKTKIKGLLKRYHNNFYVMWRHYNGFSKDKTYANAILKKVIFLRKVLK